jgi:CRP-like cAMP-binding protein
MLIAVDRPDIWAGFAVMTVPAATEERLRPAAFHVVRSGALLITEPDDPGSVLVGLAGTDDHLDDSGPGLRVRALTDCLLVQVTEQRLATVLADRPDVAGRLLAERAGWAKARVQRLAHLRALDVTGRVADLLLRLASYAGRPVDNRRTYVPLELSQAEIGQLVGTRRESVCTTMVRFARQRLIDVVPGGVTILDPSRLRRRAGYPDAVRADPRTANAAHMSRIAGAVSSSV